MKRIKPFVIAQQVFDIEKIDMLYNYINSNIHVELLLEIATFRNTNCNIATLLT